MEELKTCKTCGCIKPLIDFQFRKDKYRGDCKQCRYECIRGWRVKHPEQCKEYNHKYHADHLERARENQWCANHPMGRQSSRTRKNREWHRKHPEKHSENGRKWHVNHREQCNVIVNGAMTTLIKE
jgi:hypothetical protein